MKCKHPFAKCPDMTEDKGCLLEDIDKCPLKWVQKVKAILHRPLCRLGWHSWEEHRHKTGKARRRCRWCLTQFRGVWSPLPIEARGIKDFKRKDREMRKRVRFK